MPALVSRAARVFWTSGSTLTIVAAISISVVRLMLPDIAQHRESIESWLSDISSRPVQIGEVSASWQGWAPKINIKNKHENIEDYTVDDIEWEEKYEHHDTIFMKMSA